MASLRGNPAPQPKPHHNLRYMDWNFNAIYTTKSENKLVKTFLEAVTLTGLAASIAGLQKKSSQRKLHFRPKQQCDELHEVHRRDAA